MPAVRTLEAAAERVGQTISICALLIRRYDFCTHGTRDIVDLASEHQYVMSVQQIGNLIC